MCIVCCVAGRMQGNVGRPEGVWQVAVAAAVAAAGRTYIPSVVNGINSGIAHVIF